MGWITGGGYERWARGYDRVTQILTERGMTREDMLREINRRVEAGEYTRRRDDRGEVLYCNHCGHVFYSAGPYAIPPVPEWRFLEALDHQCEAALSE